jgi:hypothetical protein
VKVDSGGCRQAAGVYCPWYSAVGFCSGSKHLHPFGPEGSVHPLASLCYLAFTLPKASPSATEWPRMRRF